MATEARETAGLIGSDKVEGTAVYDAKGEHIGSIERVMIEKISHNVCGREVCSDQCPVIKKRVQTMYKTRHLCLPKELLLFL